MGDADHDEPGDEADELLLDEFDSEEGGSDDDPDESGLELGDAQAAEIRQIFLTTLPQYLEPLEELLEQVLEKPEPDAPTLGTLGTTVASILAAARRIGVDDIAESLREMEFLVKELAVSEPEEVGDELRGMLRKIREQSGASRAEPSGAARTIVAALARVEGFDTSILESLTAAGLVTVSQLQMARKHEIMAVTGLPEASVDGLLHALEIEPVLPGASAVDRRRDGELERHLRAQVEAEEALSQVRADVQRVRSRIEVAGLELEQAEATASRLRSQGVAAEAGVTELRQARARARDELARLEVERADLEERTRRARHRLSWLRRERVRVEREQEGLREELSELGDRVHALLATAKRIRQR